MKAGTSKAPKYLPVHEIHRRLSAEQLDTLLAFHAVIACLSSVVTVKKQPGKYSNKIRIIWLALTRALLLISLWCPPWNSCVRFKACQKLTHARIKLYQSCKRNSPANLRCSKVPYHGSTLSSKCYESSTQRFCLSLKLDGCTLMAS